MPVVYASVVLLSALLLFLVQPLIGRYILPWFGGSSAVWSAAQLFFQFLLFIGHIYSHIVVRWLSRQRQVWVHAALVVLALGLMVLNLATWETPITPGSIWAPQPEGSPLAQILATLAVSVGLPYLVLATTSPLLQAWFAKRYPERSPYPLYALSNAGSIAALLAYPLAMEPGLTVQGQAWLWSAGFLVFAVGVALVILEPARHRASQTVSMQRGDNGRLGARWHPLLWLGLSACGSILLLGATNQMTQNVAAVPLLWVVPLALYLLSFVVAFATDRPVSRWSMGLLLLVMPAFRGSLVRGNALPISVQLGAYALVIFAGCTVCHGELARLRPRADRLTQFYLTTSAGGALGGLFVNLAAPRIFADYWELPIGVGLCWVLAVVALAGEWETLPQRATRRQAWAILLALVGALYAGSIVIAAVSAFNRATLDAARNFYGIQRVQMMTIDGADEPAVQAHQGVETERLAYRLVHGTTVHGVQYVGPELRGDPTSYYCPTSGVGLVLTQSMRQHPTHTIAVLGLGAGTIATYGRPGDRIVFYEIDPQVIAYADGAGGYFSYLRDSRAAVDIVRGDARLSLAREFADGGSRRYDLVVVDVFSGDAPPVHFLTREAFALYLAHLAPEGLLAMHISTTHVDLKPVVVALARDAGVSGVLVEDLGDGQTCFPSRWAVMARQPEALGSGLWETYHDLQTAYDPAVRLWTDSYSNLIRVILH
ncbi:MAG: fused MFS/spermidine synthase [Anaerolineae bacterium]|nr:fused MFS/spermidine synthase [Anaerolineae bacterium]